MMVMPQQGWNIDVAYNTAQTVMTLKTKKRNVRLKIRRVAMFTEWLHLGNTRNNHQSEPRYDRIYSLAGHLVGVMVDLCFAMTVGLM